MLFLDASTKLQIVLGAAHTTNALTWTAHSVTIPTREQALATGTTNGTTDVDMVAAAVLAIKGISVQNADTTTQTVTIKTDNAATERILFKVALLTLETLVYDDGAGWRVYDSSGQVKTASANQPGLWLKTTILTSGTSFVTGPRATSIYVRMVGGGGGGGGCTSVAAAASAAGGGGAGGYAEKTFTVTPNTAYTYAVGAAGNGVSGAGGANGTSSTFAVGATTVTALLGSGAAVATALTTLSAYAGGAGGTVSTNGDVNSSGQHGAPGLTLIVATPIVASGGGGSGPFGAGGKGIAAVGAGVNAIGFGAGGGGAATGASTVRTGGNGTAGIIVVDEFA